MRTNIPYICEGEIYQCQKAVGSSRKTLRYICKVNFADGSSSLIPNCVQSTMFGGIDDYLQFRSRTSNDSGANIETSNVDEKNSAQIGDRVYISFVGGNLQKPVIIGYAQHPNETYEFADESDPSDIDPSLVFKYLGIKATVDNDGQLRLIHRGAPSIDYVPRQGGALGALESAAASAIAGPGTDTPNPAVTPQDSTEITLLEFLKGGVFRLRDANGQMIEVDRTSKTITISNNAFKSTDAEDLSVAEEAESIVFDAGEKSLSLQARELISIYSEKDREDETDGDYSHKITSDSKTIIEGDNTETISGDEEVTIEGDKTLKVTGDRKDTVMGDWTVSTDGDITLKTAAGAFLKMVSGKINFGGATAELLDLFDQTLTQLGQLTTAMEAETHIGNLGYPTSPPINVAAYVAVQTALAQIQAMLDAIKG